MSPIPLPAALADPQSNGAIVNASDGGRGKPVVLGYMCRELLTGDRQVADLELRMKHFAEAEGLRLGFVYVEQAVARPVAFGALVESLAHSAGHAVLLPGLLHFAVLGPQDDIKPLFEWVTGARVLIL
ncbi:hypothetical protein [Kribbella italica]|uniref:Resolvase/invertase-type recombinase catalytic domain-containing protein n=1 Tax=Kribbella italica TaxID=1540520 RepID=A0A7W9JGL6_9ACTN|nr:hypothetical protein [Kribbella italica]MBB5841450.1 hypothetical protein [Kribbella italica]